MRNLKRVLTLVMAVAMMMSLLVVGAGAAFNDQDKIENTDAVNMNVALGVIKGRDTGAFDPTGNVTRAEMAKMICVMLNGGNEPTLGTKATATFKDTKGHWAEAYIEYCTSLGIVAGMGDGTFAPNANVTGTQAAKMLLVAMGYDAAFEGFNGASWSVKINVAANQKELYDDLAIDPNAALNRDDAAQMVWNALNAVEVKYTYSLTTVNGQLQNVQVREDKTGLVAPTMLVTKFNASDLEGTMNKFFYNSNKKEFTYTVGAQNFTTKVDFTGLYGQNVKIVYKNNTSNTVYGMYAEDSAVLFSGVVNDLTINSDSVKFDGTTYDLEGTKTNTYAYEYTYNTTFASANKVALSAVDGTDTLTYTFKAIDDDNDGKVDFFVTYPYVVEKITYVGSKNLTTNKVPVSGTSSYTIADCDVYTGAAKDDYAKVTKAANTATNTTTFEEVAKLVDGKATAVKSTTITIDGTAYEKHPSGSAIAVGATVKNAVVVNGFIFSADATGSTSVEDYVVLLAKDAAPGGGSTEIAKYKLMFSDGTKKVVEAKASDVAGVTIGQLYTYDINSDDEYELSTPSFNVSGDGHGFDTAYDGTDATIAKDAIGAKSGKVGTMNNWNIADDAVIFLQEGATPDYKVITGARLKALAFTAGAGVNDDPIRVYSAFANDSSSGFSTVHMAFVKTTGAVVSGDRLFGYATTSNAQVKNSKNETVYELKLWNGTTDITVLTKNGVNASDVQKGDVVEYTLNADGVADTIKVYNTDTTAPSAQLVGITAISGKELTTTSVVDTGRLDITDDTVIIYVDHDKFVGVEAGTISKANDNAGVYDRNAVVVMDTGNDIALVVYDINNKFTDVQTVAFNIAAPTAAQVNAQLANGNVAVAGNWTADAAVTVPAGKTLTVTGTLTLTTNAFVVNGTLNANAIADANIAQLDISATGTINFTAAPSVAVMTELETIAAAGAKVSFAAAATSVAANEWYTTKGTADTDATAATNGTAATAVGATSAVAIGTYTFGMLGYTGADGVVAPNVTGWFK